MKAPFQSTRATLSPAPASAWAQTERAPRMCRCVCQAVRGRIVCWGLRGWRTA